MTTRTQTQPRARTRHANQNKTKPQTTRTTPHHNGRRPPTPPRIKWHQKLGTLLSSQETDTHHPDPRQTTRNPNWGNRSMLTIRRLPVNLPRSLATSTDRLVRPPGRPLTDDRVAGWIFSGFCSAGPAARTSRSRSSVPPVRGST